MISRIFAMVAALGLAATAQASIWFSSAPSPVQAGTSYYVEASASGGSFTITVYKGGGWFASANGAGWGSAGSSTTDYSTGTVNYSAELYDWNAMDYDYAYASVTITPANNPPTITWINNPSTAYVNQWFNVQARGNDSNGNLTWVRVWKDDVPFAFNDGGNGSEKYSDNNAAQGTAVGTITFKAKAGDGAGAESSYIYHYVSIIKADQTITFNQPAAQSYGGQLALSASASSGLGVSFSVLSGPASLSGNTLTFTGVGSVSVRASQGGDGAYNAAANVDRTITVNQAGQTITFNQPAAQTYGTPLSLSATASSGLSVSFSVVSGPATLSGNTLTFTGAGSVVVRAAQGGNTNYSAASNVDRTITVNPASQTITFNQPGTQTYGTPLTLGATASSGLTVTYSIVSGPATVSGNTVTFTGAGSVVVRAAQAGNANYSAASNVDRTVTVNQASQTITFNQPAAQTYGTPLNLSATASSGLAVTYSIVSGPATVSGSTVTFTGTGSVVIRAAQAGNANYSAASNVDRTVTVNQASQTITFNQPAAQTFGTPLNLSATASSGLAVTYSIVSGPATVSGSTVTFTGTGSVVIRAAQAGNANYTAAANMDRTVSVAAQATTFALSATSFTYTGSAQGPTVVPTPSGATFSTGGTLSATNVGSYTGTATATGNYTGSNNALTWSIAANSQTITFTQPAAQNYGTPLNPGATASSGLTVTYSIVSGPATVSGSTVTFTGVGSVVIRASQAGNTNYGAAASVDRTVTVNKGSQTITFAQPAAQTFGTPLTLGATASSGLGVTYSIVSGPATVSGSTVTFTGTGSVVIRAAQAGNANYDAAANVDRTVTVNARPVTFALSATTFTYNGTAQGPTVVPTPAGATFTTGGTLSATNAGSYTATATGTGNYTGTNNALTWTIAKAIPGSVFAARTLSAPSASGYTVLVTDLDAVFTAVGSGATPTGTVTYAVQSASGSGASPTSGAVTSGTVFTPGTYTIRASYPGDTNYTTATKDAVWTVTYDPNADSDGDGMPNSWESSNGLNPSSGSDGSLDPDGDGLTNVAEYNLGKNPQSYNAGTSTLGGAIPGGWPNAAGASTYAVGMTAGSLGVDKNGAANYSIPLWTVPGTSGMQPQLALNYSSQGGAGWLGFGWSLSGLSAITRGPQTKATDDAITGVDFTSADRFYLDGQRLIYVSGGSGYGTNNAEYRTEIDSISKIVSYGTAGAGPAYFKVWTKAGLIIELGATGDSAANAQGRGDGAILAWAVNKISDTKGNYMEFVYAEDTNAGEQKISRINYTGNTGASLATYASVRFTYENRTDTFNGYTSGSKVARSQRIKHIGAFYGETEVRRYTLDYTERANTGRSLLTTLHEIAPSDGREYPPMTFEYDEAETGWTTLGSGWDLPVVIGEHQQEQKGTGFVDLNGDGRPDLVQYRVSNTGSNLGRGAWLNTVNGWVASDGSSGSVDYRLPAALARAGTVDAGTRFADVNNDGLADFIDLNARKVYLNTPGTGFVENTGWALPTPDLPSYVTDPLSGNPLDPRRTVNSYYYSGSLGSFIDKDGDGRADFVGYFGTFTVYFADNPAFAEQFVVADGYRNTGTAWEYKDNYGGASDRLQGFRYMDVNADGRLDLVQNWYGNNSEQKHVYLGTSTGWMPLTNTASPTDLFDYYVPPVRLNVGTTGNDNAPFGTEAADLNGDGLVDLVQRNNVTTDIAYLGTGTGWVQAAAAFQAPFLLTDNNTPQGAALMDINSDGLVDLVRAWGGTKEIRLGTGRGWSANVSAHVLPRDLASSGHPTLGSDFVDLDADGAVDQIWSWMESSSVTKGGALNKSKPADRLKKVTNGFGVAAQLTYAPLTERDGSGNYTVYDKGTGGPTDTTNIIAPMYVVKTVSNDDGAGGQYAVNYRYGGLRAHRLRGSLGFEWTQSTDARTSIVSKTTYKQEYPFIGMVAATETKSGSTTLSSSSVTYADKNATGSIRLPYASVVTQSANDLNGAALSSSTTTTQIDTYGNVTSIVVDTGGGFTKTTTNSYTDNTGSWLLGRLTGSTVASAATGKSTVTRTSSFTYNGTTGLLETETVEPNDNTLKLTTTYGYDAFGNKTSVSVAGAAITVDSSGNLTAGSNVTRTTVTAYDSKGRFPISATNALSHTETYDDYDQGLGVLKQMTGANDLTTSWTYDSFGLKTRETRADGTVTDYRLKWAGSGAPAGAHTLVETESTGVAPSLVFNDSFGRAFWALSINGDGTIIYQKTAYDSMGRAYAKSNPSATHSASGDWADPFDTNPANTVFWTRTATNAYDALNRPAWVQTPDDTAGYVTTSYSYNGRETSVTDPLGRVARSTVNTQGWLIEAVRNNAGGANDRAVVTYDYDALGNLTTTNASGITTTLAYDLRGRKTSMTDADMGTWLYRYNIFGELIWQKDAKNQISTLAYDALGRLTSRVETEGTTTWTYDTSPTKGIGKLYTVTAPGSYSETNTYDSYGRPSSLARVIDGTTYTTSQAYDSAGRVNKMVYPTGFQSRNVYNAFGYLKEVRKYVTADDGKPLNQLQGYVYWMADHYAVMGQVDGELYGNGLTNDRVYSVKTGRLQGAAVGKGFESTSPYSVQYLTYTRDAMGNVTGRNDTAPGVGRSEVFAYDALDRLTSHTVNSGTAVTVAYDAKGNITSKSDVGTYAYAGTGPHAVSGVSGGPLGTQTYAYDANGNMTSGAGRIITWKSFNQVASITKGSFTSTFSFGADHERVKQVSHLGTTIYAGGTYEKFTNIGGGYEHKHYIYAPTGRIAVYTERSDLSKDVRYFHTDGLGSITAVTNELGAVVKRFAFDAWGKRLDPGTGSTITGTTASGFSRGFTDHEQLDDLGLIHMNGRVYDPVLGRFLSADPFVGSETDSQEFNRYSYLTNNPLAGTDPSGFFSLKDVVKIVAIVVVAYFTAGWGVQLAGAMGFTTSVTVAGVTSTTLAGAIAGGIGAGFGSGFAGSLLNGGSIGDAFKAGVIGGIVGGITGGLLNRVGAATWGKGEFGSAGWARKALAHGLIQGGMQEATGGEFRHGFYAGVVVGALEGKVAQFAKDSDELGIAVSAVLGGTASAVGGGKFANGAVSGAFSYMFNQMSRRNANARAIAEEQSEKAAEKLTSAGVATANLEAARRASLPSQRHHLITWMSKTFNFQMHKLVRMLNIDLKNDPRNMVDVKGHSGRHWNEYHKDVQRRLDFALESVETGRWTADHAMDVVWKSIIRDINSGKLLLYENTPLTTQ